MGPNGSLNPGLELTPQLLINIYTIWIMSLLRMTIAPVSSGRFYHPNSQIFNIMVSRTLGTRMTALNTIINMVSDMTQKMVVSLAIPEQIRTLMLLLTHHQAGQRPLGG